MTCLQAPYDSIRVCKALDDIVAGRIRWVAHDLELDLYVGTDDSWVFSIFFDVGEPDYINWVVAAGHGLAYLTDDGEEEWIAVRRKFGEDATIAALKALMQRAVAVQGEA